MGFFSSLGFLAPLYVAGGLAIGLPILFHLIRRTPKGRQEFSSVMFLSPSPPRITRRSRIEHWLLLLLRALAVLLIVAAFCRPLWRTIASEPDSQAGRNVVLLLDTSASMQRSGLWGEAVRQALGRLADLSPIDQLTILTFSDQVSPLLEPGEWNELDPAQRQAVITARLNELQPGWGATHLDTALLAAADRLEQADAGEDAGRKRVVWVVSDLTEGSRWQGLQGREWPRRIDVELLRVGAKLSPTNAGLQLVGTPEGGETPFVRLRVTNAANSQRERFELGWREAVADPQSPGPTTGLMQVYVPPGQSRVLRLPCATGDFAPTQAALGGDDHEFDNLCSVTWPERRTERVVYLGADGATDRDGLLFFLAPLFPDTSRRTVEIVAALPQSSDPHDRPHLVIAGGKLDAARLTRLRDWVRSGGVLLYVCRDAESAGTLFELTASPPRPLQEAQVADYAMLRDVDFRHPLFQRLDDARYSDLSKVHFWKYRVLADDALPGAQVLARFDSGDAALLEAPLGTGRLLVLTSGWNRADSRLATWPKFVAIMNALLETAGPRRSDVSQLVVGEPLPVQLLEQLGTPPQHVTLPDGSEAAWSAIRAAPQTRLPGLYRVYGTSGDSSPSEPSREPAAVIAVNLPAAESNTAPLSIDLLASLGIALPPDAADEAATTEHREQLAGSELESRQKLWRWLLGGALVVLLLETVLAARRARPLEQVPVP